MNLLLPQNRTATVVAAREVDLHGDRFVDVTLSLDGEAAPVTSRVAANECPAALAPGDRVLARIVVGVITRLSRPSSEDGPPRERDGPRFPKG